MPIKHGFCPPCTPPIPTGRSTHDSPASPPTTPSSSSDSQIIPLPEYTVKLTYPERGHHSTMNDTLPQQSSSRRSSASPIRHPFYHSQSDNALGDVGSRMMDKRRMSRMDPMGRDDEMDEDEGYGELGHRHPLRRVQEESGEETRTRLPGIRSLLNAADHPSQSSSSSNSSSMFTPPSLPSLIPGSPSSSTSPQRSSRYSSLNSSISQETPGWWSQDRDYAPSASMPPPNLRHNSFPLVHPFHADDHDAKRRRSDLPMSTQDSEEAARLRWQAQSRNASFPLAATVAPAPGQSGLRKLLHPAVSSGMSRGSISGSTILPNRRESQAPSYDRRESQIAPHERRESQLPSDMRRPLPGSRQMSLVGGQLARAFGDLSANDGSPQREMPPPYLPLPMDRRTSSLSPRPSSESLLQQTGARSAPPPTARSGEYPSRRGSGAQDTVDLSSRPGSSEGTVTRVTPPRSSLTEAIMARAGDEVAYTGSSRRSDPSESRPGSIPLEKASLSEPVPGAAAPYWGRRSSSEQAGRGMNGMEVLAESARRISEEDGHPGELGLDSDVPGTIVQGPSGPKYSCNYCNKTFSRPSSLRIHTYSHTGERPFVCPEPTCQRRFSVQSNLKRHAKVHQLGSTPFLSNGMPLAPMPGHMHPHPGHSGWPPHMMTAPMTAPAGMMRGPMAPGYLMQGHALPGPGHMLPPLQHSPFHPGPGGAFGAGPGRYHPYDHEMLRHPGLPRTQSTPADYARMDRPAGAGRRSPRQEMAMRGWQGEDEEEEVDEAALDELDEDERRVLKEERLQ